MAPLRWQQIKFLVLQQDNSCFLIPPLVSFTRELKDDEDFVSGFSVLSWMHLRTLEESASHTNLTIDHLSWCSSFFSIALKNAMTKSKLMRNEFIWLTGHQKEPRQKFKQSRKRAHDWLCIMSQIYLFKGGTSHSRLGLHTSVVNNETQRSPQINVMEAFSQLTFILTTWPYLVSRWQETTQRSWQ